jgi:methylated-DNA-protein-cysteine methyltransferase related protein
MTSRFYADVYRLVRQVPRGRVTTYGSIARALGMPRGARQVGWALAALNGRGRRVPAHRVVNARGALSGAWAFGRPLAQRRRLEQDGVCFDADGRVPLERYLWEDWEPQTR